MLYNFSCIIQNNGITFEDVDAGTIVKIQAKKELSINIDNLVNDGTLLILLEKIPKKSLKCFDFDNIEELNIRNFNKNIQISFIVNKSNIGVCSNFKSHLKLYDNIMRRKKISNILVT